MLTGGPGRPCRVGSGWNAGLAQRCPLQASRGPRGAPLPAGLPCSRWRQRGVAVPLQAQVCSPLGRVWPGPWAGQPGASVAHTACGTEKHPEGCCSGWPSANPAPQPPPAGGPKRAAPQSRGSRTSCSDSGLGLFAAVPQGRETPQAPPHESSPQMTNGKGRAKPRPPSARPSDMPGTQQKPSAPCADPLPRPPALEQHLSQRVSWAGSAHPGSLLDSPRQEGLQREGSGRLTLGPEPALAPPCRLVARGPHPTLVPVCAKHRAASPSRDGLSAEAGAGIGMCRHTAHCHFLTGAD